MILNALPSIVEEGRAFVLILHGQGYTLAAQVYLCDFYLYMLVKRQYVARMCYAPMGYL